MSVGVSHPDTEVIKLSIQTGRNASSDSDTLNSFVKILHLSITLNSANKDILGTWVGIRLTHFFFGFVVRNRISDG